MEANHKMSFRVKFLGLSVATVLLAACGGGGGSGTSNVTSTSISGIAVDGPIAGATVTFTDCGNVKVITKADGTFTTPNGCTGSAYTVTGGTDTGTNTAFTGQLSSKFDSSSTVTVASPLTTLLVSNPQLVGLFNSLLGVNSNPFATNPLTDTASLKADLVVAALLGQVTTALTNAGANPVAAATAAANALAQVLASGSGTGSTAVLVDPTNIASVIAKAATAASVTLPSGTASTITSQVAAVNAAVANVQASSNPAVTLSALQTTVLPAITSAISNPTLINYIQLGNVALNGTSKTLAQVQASTSAAPIAVSGGLNDLQISMKGLGNYVNTTQTVSANLKYTIGSNTVNLTINGIKLAFDGTGALSSATVPAGSAYTFSLSGASTASGAFTNNVQDTLFASGAVDLSISTFLSKLSGAAKLSTTQLAAYTPASGVSTTATFMMSSGTVNTPLLVGDGAGLAVSSVTATVN